MGEKKKLKPFEMLARQMQAAVDFERLARSGVFSSSITRSSVVPMFPPGLSTAYCNVNPLKVEIPATTIPDPALKDRYFIPGPPSKAAMREVRRKIAQGGKFLQITKSPNIYHLRVAADDERNLLDRESEHHFGDWHVEEIEDDRPRLLESFDHFDDAVAYVNRVLSEREDEDAQKYASVGEVPC